MGAPWRWVPARCPPSSPATRKSSAWPAVSAAPPRWTLVLDDCWGLPLQLLSAESSRRALNACSHPESQVGQCQAGVLRLCSAPVPQACSLCWRCTCRLTRAPASWTAPCWAQASCAPCACFDFDLNTDAQVVLSHVISTYQSSYFALSAGDTGYLGKTMLVTGTISFAALHLVGRAGHLSAVPSLSWDILAAQCFPRLFSWCRRVCCALDC